jgi:hypothetical protein
MRGLSPVRLETRSGRLKMRRRNLILLRQPGLKAPVYTPLRGAKAAEAAYNASRDVGYEKPSENPSWRN